MPSSLPAHRFLSIPARDAFQLQLTPFNSTPDEQDAATDELEELRKDVNRLDVAWGEETNYYTVQGGHGQREGFHGHDGAHYRGGYDRGGGRGGGRGPGGGSPFGGGGGRGGRGEGPVLARDAADWRRLTGHGQGLGRGCRWSAEGGAGGRAML